MVALAEVVDVTGWKSIGSRIADGDLREVQPLGEEGEVAKLF
jgi:hypothetical protein